MASFSAADDLYRSQTSTPAIAALQNAVLWLVGMSGSIVFIEPSPYELSTLAALIVFFATGLKLRAVFLPLLILLTLINIGYTISALGLLDKLPIFNWIATSWYLFVTAAFFAMVLSEDTANRINYLLRGYVVGALIASIAGIAGYFNLIPGGYDLLTLYGRAKGTFKDPNVLGAFLLLPALVTLQSVLVDRFAKSMRSAVAFLIISLGILLSFSRAAWGMLVLGSLAVVVVMLLTSRSQSQRMRIVLLTSLAVVGAVFLLSILFSFQSVGDLLKERATLDQGYDSGRFGRFGRYLLGAQMTLEYPFGIGPLQFTRYFPEDTHNSFLNAFMSGGWLAGTGYLALIVATVRYGARYLFAYTPWRNAYIVVFLAFAATVAEGMIIDTDHWRHFFLMLGAVWGMFAATQIELRRQDSPVSMM